MIRRLPAFLLGLILAGGGTAVAAQPPAPLRPGTDLVVHRFHPAPALTAAAASARGRTAASQDLDPAALQQIAALYADKAARTPAQAKIDSQHLYTARMLRHQPAAPGVDWLDTGVELDAADALVSELTAEVTADLLARLQAAGVQVLESHPAARHLLALVPAAQVETIAAWPEIHFIGPRQQATTSWRGPAPAPAGLAWPGTVAASAAFASDPEGDAAHQADLARTVFNVDGTGVKVGVLSDGVASLDSSQALGALGPVTVVTVGGQLQTGTGDEGTAMLEIIHALAPGAGLYFATGFGSIEAMAANIRALRAAGCDIIVDDVSYFVESRFQDGQGPLVVSSSHGGAIIQAVKDVVADGALYFSAAANDGNLDAGTAGVYEGDFVDGGAETTPLAGTGRMHRFAPGLTYDTLVAAGGPVILSWADPLGAAADDYDLYVLDATGSTVVTASTNTQNGTTDPVEGVGTPAAGSRLVVVKAAGQARYLNLSTNRGRLAQATAGATYGHNAAGAGYSVAASPAPGGAAFTAASGLESFSSDGPRRIFFQGDGTPITPGDFSATGGSVLAKPDFTAADGVTVTGVGGFGSPFYGTSAAAPHAAAIAALALSATPGVPRAELQDALAGQAIDILDPGWDRDAGAGILMAYPTLAALGARSYANPVLAAAAAAEHPGNGNGFLEIGEGGQVTVQLVNASPGPAATGITAALAAATPGVTVALPDTVAYPDLAPGATAAGSFLVTVGPAVDPAAATLDFVLAVQFAGGASASRQLAFSVPLGISETLTHRVGAAPGSLAGATATTGVQDGRITRNGVASTCAAPKLWPGTYLAGSSFAYDAYTFTACRSGCAQVQVTGAGTSVFLSVYSPGYDPANPSTTYLGDAGGSLSTATVELTLTAGRTYTAVVNEVAPGVTGDPYTLVLPSAFLNCAVPNQAPVALARDRSLTADPAGTAAANVDNGSYDPDHDALTLSQAPAGPYPVGTTRVLLTATDPRGAMGQAAAQVTVNPIPTATTLTTTTGVYGSTGLTAQVTAAGFTPTGSVQFTENGTSLGSAPVGAGGRATLAVPGLAVASHRIAASFTGTGGFGPSSAVESAVVVAVEPTTVTVASPGPSPRGAELALTATVGCAYGTPTGMVTFLDGGTALGTAALAGATAVCRTSALAPGTHAITASYSGDGSFAAGLSAPWSQDVVLTLSLVPDTPTLAMSTRQGGSLHLTVASVGALDGPVSLACTGLPPGVTATFSPSLVAPDQLPADVTVTLAWSASARLTPLPGPPGTGPWPWLAVGAALLAVPSGRRRGRFLALVLGLGLAGLVSCSGGGGGAASSTLHYTLAFTAAAQDGPRATTTVRLDVTP